MKNNRILAMIGLIFLNVIAGYLVISVALGGTSSFDKIVKQAEQYCADGLYQKSINEYDKALAIKSDPETYIAQLNVYRVGIDDGELSNSYELKSKLDSIIAEYYDNASIYEAVCTFCMDYEEYESCVTYLKQAKSQKIKSDILDGIYEEVRYKFKDEYTMYDEVSYESNGNYVVEANKLKSIIDKNGENMLAGAYIWATHFSPAIRVDGNTTSYAIVSKKNNYEKQKNYIVDVSGTKQIYIPDDITGAGAIGVVSSGKTQKYVFPCEKEKQFYFYSFDPVSEKVEQINEKPYLYAGTYRNNVVAVRVSENEWQILDGSGKPFEQKFTDIKLNDAGECAPKGLIFAATDGKYHLYHLNEKGELVDVNKNFSCEDAKAFADGSYAAVKINGLWGFVDAKGEIVINSQYSNANSFSMGIGAVLDESGKWKLIKTSGEAIGSAEYDEVTEFSTSGKCFVKDGDHWTSIQLYYVD